MLAVNAASALAFNGLSMTHSTRAATVTMGAKEELATALNPAIGCAHSSASITKAHCHATPSQCKRSPSCCTV